MSPAIRTEHYDPDRHGQMGEPTTRRDIHGERDQTSTLLMLLPAAIERARERGQPVFFPEASLPENPEKRAASLRLLDSLGVEIA